MSVLIRFEIWGNWGTDFICGHKCWCLNITVWKIRNGWHLHNLTLENIFCIILEIYNLLLTFYKSIEIYLKLYFFWIAVGHVTIYLSICLLKFAEEYRNWFFDAFHNKSSSIIHINNIILGVELNMKTLAWKIDNLLLKPISFINLNLRFTFLEKLIRVISPDCWQLCSQSESVCNVVVEWVHLFCQYLCCW